MGEQNLPQGAQLTPGCEAGNIGDNEPAVLCRLTNVEAEKIVLGSLLLDNDKHHRLLGALTASDFSVPDHQSIFQAVQQVAPITGPIDPVLVHTQTLDPSVLTVQLQALLNLRSDFGTQADVWEFVSDIRAKSALRKLYKVVSRTTRLILGATPPNVNQLAKDVTYQLEGISEAYNQSDTQHAAILQRTLDAIVGTIRAKQESPNDTTGLLTGFPKLDKITLGLQGGDLIVVAGRPAMGKTAFAMNIVEQVILAGQASVAVFSMEMSRTQILTRMISSVGLVGLQKMATGKLIVQDWAAITKAVGIIGASQLLIDDSSYLTPSDVRTKILSWQASTRNKLGLVVIDYIQLMNSSGSGENRAAEVSSITRALKRLAKDLSVPIIIISQLNRALEQRSCKKPIMADLKDSGAIEQDADLILFVYRSDIYSTAAKLKGKAEIIVGKHRNGPTGTVVLDYQGEYTKFRTS